MCELSLGTISCGTLEEEPLPTPPSSISQGTDALLVNLESQRHLEVVPLGECCTERRHLSRRPRLTQFEQKPPPGYVVTERLLLGRFRSLS